MPATTLCLINQKGGCGKSSTCFHLAGYLANRNLNVLLVDADPQGSLSQGFFGSALVENLPPEQTLAVVFDDERFLSDPSRLPVATAFERISVVPANQNLAAHNIPDPEQAGMKQFLLGSFLEELEGFDLVLIDCPPNLYQCSWSAMLASDFVVIPVPPEDFGTQGLRVVHQAIQNAHHLNPRLELLGHLITRFDRRLVVHRSYEAKLRKLYRESMLDTVVPEATAFKVSLACRKPVTYFSSKSQAGEAMSHLGEELLERIALVVEQRSVA